MALPPFSQRSCFEHFVFTMVICAFIGALGVIAGALALFIEYGNKMQLLSAVMRAYVMVGGIILVGTEIKWKPFLLQFKFLLPWVGRGVFQIFIGLLQAAPVVYSQTPDGGDVDNVKTKNFQCFYYPGKTEELIRYATGFLLFAVGSVYFVSGIFITCFLHKADPGYTDPDSLEDQAKKGLEAAKGKAKSAGSEGKAAVESAADKYVPPSTASNPPPKNDNPFAI